MATNQRTTVKKPTSSQLLKFGYNWHSRKYCGQSYQQPAGKTMYACFQTQLLTSVQVATDIKD